MQVIVSCGPDQQGGLAVSTAQQLTDAVHKPFAPDKTVLLIDLVGAVRWNMLMLLCEES